MFFIFFISPLTLVKPLPVTERTQLLYKAHRCVVPRPHPYTDPRRFFDDTRSSFRFVQPLLSRLSTRDDEPNFLGDGTGPLGFSSFTWPRGKDSVFLDTDSSTILHLASRHDFFYLTFFYLIFHFSRLEREREIVRPQRLKLTLSHRSRLI